MAEYILIVEDDASLAKGLCRALESPEIRTECCGTLKEAERRLEEWGQERGRLPLLLLDVNLPDGSGFDFLKAVKETYDIPVILLTANDMELDIVAGLEQGADDYITKPFSLAVLRARVAAVLRRRHPGASEESAREADAAPPGLQKANSDASGVMVEPEAAHWGDSGDAACNDLHVIFDEYDLDFGRMLFCVKGHPIELGKTEQKLLRYFIANRGATLNRSMLIDRIWSDGAEYVDENALSVAVNRLREKLSARAYIKTVYGVGYVWAKERQEPYE